MCCAARCAEKADQCVAACGGINAYEFRPDGRVEVIPLKLCDGMLRRCSNSACYLSRRGSSGRHADPQGTRMTGPAVATTEMIRNLHDRQIGHESRSVLEASNLDAYGRLLTSTGNGSGNALEAISNARPMDHWYEVGRRDRRRGRQVNRGRRRWLPDVPGRRPRTSSTAGSRRWKGSANCDSKSISEDYGF